MARGLTGEQYQARTLAHSLRLPGTSPVVAATYKPQGIHSLEQHLTTRLQDTIHTTVYFSKPT